MVVVDTHKKKRNREIHFLLKFSHAKLGASTMRKFVDLSIIQKDFALNKKNKANVCKKIRVTRTQKNGFK